jgi:hypothetical protein
MTDREMMKKNLSTAKRRPVKRATRRRVTMQSTTAYLTRSGVRFKSMNYYNAADVASLLDGLAGRRLSGKPRRRKVIIRFDPADVRAIWIRNTGGNPGFIKMNNCDAGLAGLPFMHCEKVREFAERCGLRLISDADFHKARNTLRKHWEILAAKPPLHLTALISREVDAAASSQIPPTKPSPKRRRRSKV